MKSTVDAGNLGGGNSSTHMKEDVIHRGSVALKSDNPSKRNILEKLGLSSKCKAWLIFDSGTGGKNYNFGEGTSHDPRLGMELAKCPSQTADGMAGLSSAAGK